MNIMCNNYFKNDSRKNGKEGKTRVSSLAQLGRAHARLAILLKD